MPRCLSTPIREISLSLSLQTRIFLSEAESFGLFSSYTFTFSPWFFFPLLPEPIRSLPISIWGLFPSSFYSLQLINLAGLIRGTVWHKSIHSVTGNTHKYDSCIAFKMHLQLFSSAHVEHVSYCQSRRIWVETLKAERRSLVTVLLQHLHTVTHTHTHFLYFLSSALMPPPHQTWSQSGSRVLGRRTKTLPVSCMWMDLIRWWFNLGVCGASESAASWLWALMSSAKNYLRRKISVHESGWGKKKKKWRLAPTCPAWLL